MGGDIEAVDLLIVGAGWHGLAMAKTYLEVHAHPKPKIAILDEAASLGGTWAEERLYPGLKTNNTAGSYEFSDFPMSLKRYGLKPGQHIPGAVVHQYLEDFAQHFGLDTLIRLRKRVDKAILQEDGTWLVYHSSTAGQVHTAQLVARKLVVATGVTSTPNMPMLHSQDKFRGHVFHAKELRSRADDLASSRDVVVIGGNKSAWDVCYAAASAGAQVHMVMRPSGGGPSWVWRPLRLGPFQMTLARLSSTRFSTWFDPAPFGASWAGIRHFLHSTMPGRWIIWFFWAALGFCVEWAMGYRDPRLKMLRPWTSIFWMGNSLSIHNYNSDWFELVRKGQLEVHHADIVSCDETSVQLCSGRSLRADAVVCCTGWKCAPTIKFEPDWVAAEIGLPTGDAPEEDRQSGETVPDGVRKVKSAGIKLRDCRLPNKDDLALTFDVRKRLVRCFPQLGRRPPRSIPGHSGYRHDVENAKCTKISSTPYRLYRFLVPPTALFVDKRNLVFLGIHRSIHEIVVTQTQVLWITAFFQNRLPTIDPESVRHQAIWHTEYERLRRPRETGGLGDRFPDLVFDCIPYVDSLLEDLGMRTMRKTSMWRNMFEPHTLRDYQGLPCEWIHERDARNAHERK